jgi:hypothetical protein
MSQIDLINENLKAFLGEDKYNELTKDVSIGPQGRYLERIPRFENVEVNIAPEARRREDVVNPKTFVDITKE